MEKNERIEQKREELAQLLDGVPEIQKKATADLVDQAAFLAVTLEDLAENINHNGTVETYTNGEHQKGRKMSSDAKSYALFVSRYSNIISKLLKLVPGDGCRKHETPEDKMMMHEERALKYAKEKELEREAMAAFNEALDAGEVDAWHLSDFIDKYKAEHDIKK